MAKGPTSFVSAEKVLLAKMQEDKTPGAVTVMNMELRWKQLVPKSHPDIPFVGGFNAKQRANIKAMMGAWGVQSYQVLRYVIENWADFAKHVAATGGLKTFPAQPHVGFLAVHAFDAKNYWWVRLNSLQPIAKAKSPTSKVVVNVPKPTKDVASLADIEAWEKENL